MATDLNLEELAKKLYPYLAADFLSLRSGYVSGTWVPTYLGATTPGVTTHTLQDGRSIRIGAALLFAGRVAWSAATGTGDARISLPLTAANPASGVFGWSGSLWTNNVTIGAFSPQMLISQNTAYFVMWTPANNLGSAKIAVEAAGDVIFSGWYEVP